MASTAISAAREAERSSDTLPGDASALRRELDESLRTLALWMHSRDYKGFDLYDILSSPYLSGWITRTFPFNVAAVQFGKRFAGLRAREFLRVPESKNPKALALAISAYCDMARCGEDTRIDAQYLKEELKRLRSPGEPLFCWGYDWNYIGYRGTTLRKFAPNCIATYFCAEALLDMSEAFGDDEAAAMAVSAGEFLATRLNRTVDTPEHLCFSYTPEDHTRIFNNSVLAGALLARLSNGGSRCDSYSDLARRTMRYLVEEQRPDGSWAYGAKKIQSWSDSFHTGFNLMALLEYQNATRDGQFEAAMRRGYEFYRREFFLPDGTAKFLPNSIYPVDIHSCAQALITFCAFSGIDDGAVASAARVFRWTNGNMRNDDGSYAFQKHRMWLNRTPYMRWGQAWMLRALSRLKRQLNSSGSPTELRNPVPDREV